MKYLAEELSDFISAGFFANCLKTIPSSTSELVVNPYSKDSIQLAPMVFSDPRAPSGGLLEKNRMRIFIQILVEEKCLAILMLLITLNQRFQIPLAEPLVIFLNCIGARTGP